MKKLLTVLLATFSCSVLADYTPTITEVGSTLYDEKGFTYILEGNYSVSKDCKDAIVVNDQYDPDVANLDIYPVGSFAGEGCIKNARGEYEGTYFPPIGDCKLLKWDNDLHYPDFSHLKNSPLIKIQGKGCFLRKESSDIYTPLHFFNPKLKTEILKVTENISNAPNVICNFPPEQFAVWAPPQLFGAPISVGGHIGPSTFNLNIRWTVNNYITNAIRYWTNENLPNGFCIACGALGK